jgi:EAL domain-containing protein (putative c-di-GMP-specific phosphodiesterase class I)
VEERDRTRARERALIAEAIGALRAEHGPEDTAEAICQQLVRLPEAAAAWLFVFDPGGSAIPLAGAARDGTPTTQAPVPRARTAQLRARAQEGPWVERWVPRRGHPYADELRRRGVRAVAYAPFGLDDEVAGLVILAGSGQTDAAGLTERLPALVEFAGIGGAVLGPSLLQRTRFSEARNSIRTMLQESAFVPVFQPIVNLVTGEVEGYEALTRFADGTPPDVEFAEATRVGLSIELEAATLRAAMAAAAPLPPGAFLNANVSPAMVTAREPLASIVAGSRRPVVLELTEHEAITDYAVFREAVAALGLDVRLAVDDAGAGFASLRHVLELRPDIVKIDRSLVGGLEADPARQALVSGFRHLAESVACQLIAEGIETEAELAALRELGITHGQGFLLGRPAPVSELVPATA